MVSFYDCSDQSQLLAGMRQARLALRSGKLVVFPTDTVYGLAADAFDRSAVAALLSVKGRDRSSPPPVLVADRDTFAALVTEVPEPVERLIEAFWPGALTIILPSSPSLSWDLGDTRGTVAVRVPNAPVARELLAETGPLAVSSANLTGEPAACSAAQAQAMFGDRVDVYLEHGLISVGIQGTSEQFGLQLASTIVDATALVAGVGNMRVLRRGLLSTQALYDVAGGFFETSSQQQAHDVLEKGNLT